MYTSEHRSLKAQFATLQRVILVKK